jgi:5-methylcytosine-specific restriction protein A
VPWCSVSAASVPSPYARTARPKALYTAATTPDHIIPLAQGGTDTEDNIRCLCASCHRIRTAQQFGYRVPQQIGPDGWPITVTEPDSVRKT